MIKFYYKYLKRNLFKLIVYFTIILSIQFIYQQNIINQGKKKAYVNGYYNDLLKFDVEFYKYLQNIYGQLNMSENTDIFSFYNTFEKFIINNIQNSFFKEIENTYQDTYLVLPTNNRDKLLDFKLEILNNKILPTKDELNDLEVTVNQIFLKVYYKVGSDTIFNLRNIPKAKFIKLKINDINKSTFKVNLIYQVLLSLALAFFLLITLEEFFLKKKNKKN